MVGGAGAGGNHPNLQFKTTNGDDEERRERRRRRRGGGGGRIYSRIPVLCIKPPRFFFISTFFPHLSSHPVFSTMNPSVLFFPSSSSSSSPSYL